MASTDSAAGPAADEHVDRVRGEADASVIAGWDTRAFESNGSGGRSR